MAPRSAQRLRWHAFPSGRGPLDGVDDLVAPDGVGKAGDGVSPVIEVRRESGVSTPDVVGGRSGQAGEFGPFLYQCRRNSKLGELVLPVRTSDGQGKDSGVWSISGNPERSVGSVDFPQKPNTPRHRFTDVDARGHPRREG